MNGTHLKITRAVPLLAVLTLTLVGCKTGPPPPKPVAWNIHITKKTPASIEVDVVGISKSQDEQWRNVSMDEYWRPNSRERKSLQSRAKSTQFQGTSDFNIGRTDSIWQTWFSYGSYELMVLANLPGKFPSGPADQRRRILSLDKRDWEAKNQTLELEILEGDIFVKTPQKPR